MVLSIINDFGIFIDNRKGTLRLRAIQRVVTAHPLRNHSTPTEPTVLPLKIKFVFQHGGNKLQFTCCDFAIVI